MPEWASNGYRTSSPVVPTFTSMRLKESPAVSLSSCVPAEDVTAMRVLLARRPAVSTTSPCGANARSSVTWFDAGTTETGVTVTMIPACVPESGAFMFVLSPSAL